MRKIVSGGQTGVDRAGLDAALELGLAIGGWCPRGRRAEDGAIPAIYPLLETPAEFYPERTEWNVRDSDASLILTRGKPDGGTALTASLARRLGKPYLVIDLEAPVFSEMIGHWLAETNPDVLNIAGPRESSQPGIYRQALEFLRTMLTSPRS